MAHEGESPMKKLLTMMVACLVVSAVSVRPIAASSNAEKGGGERRKRSTDCGFLECGKGRSFCR